MKGEEESGIDWKDTSHSHLVRGVALGYHYYNTLLAFYTHPTMCHDEGFLAQACIINLQFFLVPKRLAIKVC